MITVNIPGVELCKVGTWQSARGEVTIAPQDLLDMVQASRDPNADAVPIKVGHTDPRFDGEPALGWVENLRVSSDGNTLIGDYMKVPSEVANQMSSSYPRRSVEFVVEMATDPNAGRPRRRLTALSLLGVTPPAVKGLGDVFTVNASAALDAMTVALITDTHGLPAEMLAGDEPAPEHHDTPAQEDTMTVKKKAGDDDPKVDPLKPGDDDGKPTAKTSGEPNDDEEADGDTDEDDTDDADGDDEDDSDGEDGALSGDAPQVITLSAGQYQELLTKANRGDQAFRAAEKTRRDEIISQALSAGQLAPAEAPKWRKQLDKDEAGTLALLSGLPKQIVPTAFLGHGDGSAAAADAEVDNLVKRIGG